MKTILLSFTLVFIVLFTGLAQTAFLDPQFGDGGVDSSIVIVSKDNNVIPWEIALLPDGKIAVGGMFEPYIENFPWVARLKANGGLDESFGKSGISLIDSGYYSHDIRNLNAQPDGKILISGAGKLSFCIYRFDTSGDLDPGFDEDGLSLTSICGFDAIEDLALSKSGKIAAVGYSCMFDARYTIALFKPDGSRDLNFNGTGYFTSKFGIEFRSFKEVEFQSDNKIVAAGQSIADDAALNMKLYVVRIDTAGNLDPGFGSSGEFSYNMEWGEDVHDMAIQKDGKILLCFGYNRLLRLNSNGTIDNSFGNNGIVEIIRNYDIYAQCVGLQPDGKIIIAGTIVEYFIDSGSMHIFLARYNEYGAPDNTFGNNGLILTPIGSYNIQTYPVSMVIQPDNKILISAVMLKNNGQVLVARFKPDASVGIETDQSAGSGINAYPNPADDYIWLENLNIGSERLTWQLFDLTGKKIRNGLVNSDPCQICLNDLSPSVYLLQVTDNNYKLIKNIRVIKK
ncbi:MAG TPA: hypothetical protein DDW27_13090 [Bacteroidales bacterium]|nr:hypothetical protein [Bacteroidales bacterium]